MFNAIINWFKCIFAFPRLWAELWSRLDGCHSMMIHVLDSHKEQKALLLAKRKHSCGILLIGISPDGPALYGRRYYLEPGVSHQDSIQPDCMIENGMLVAWGACAISDASASNRSLSLWNNGGTPAVIVPRLSPAERIQFIIRCDE